MFDMLLMIERLIVMAEQQQLLCLHRKDRLFKRDIFS